MSIVLKARAGRRPGGRVSTGAATSRLALVLARLNFSANVERAHGRAAEPRIVADLNAELSAKASVFIAASPSQSALTLRI